MNSCECCFQRNIENQLSIFMQNIQNQINNLPTSGTFGLQAELNDKSNTILDNGDIVPYNAIVSDTSGTITLSGGTFTVSKVGNYYVSYIVNINGTDQLTSITMSCNGIQSQATNAVQGQMSGFALLQLQAGDNISVINDNGGKILLSPENIQAQICILKI